MARFNPHEDSADSVYKAAEYWRDTCLLSDGSIFSSDRILWTKELLDELDERFVQNLDMGEGDFFEKLTADGPIRQASVDNDQARVGRLPNW